jgi:hypothetical protein
MRCMNFKTRELQSRGHFYRGQKGTLSKRFNMITRKWFVCQGTAGCLSEVAPGQEEWRGFLAANRPSCASSQDSDSGPGCPVIRAYQNWTLP